ncbi:MAG: response regulator [Balneolales bacterium]|nr:response regulator [Balneolales bacterium]
MSTSDEEFLKELLEDFKLEAAEHLQVIGDGLLELEKSADSGGNPTKTEEVFRVIHSMKGAARAVNLQRLEQLAMVLEGVFHEVKNKKLTLHPAMFDVLYPATDMLAALLGEIDKPLKSVSQNDFNLMIGRVQAIRNVRKGGAEPAPQPARLNTEPAAGESVPEPEPPEAQLRPQKPSPEKHTHQKKEEQEQRQPQTQQTPSEAGPEAQQDAAPADFSAVNTSGRGVSENETVRVPVTRLIEILNLAEEMITSKNILRWHADEFGESAAELARLRTRLEEELTDNRQATLPDERVALRKTIQDLRSSAGRLARLSDELSAHQRRSGRNIDELVEHMRHTLLQPFSVLFAVVPRLVRDLSKSSGKEVEIAISGAETELDRRILEQLKDPLIHLIRNSVDHGIEPKAERKKAGKSEMGKLAVKVGKADGRKVQIVIEDDGAGINRERLLEAARKSGAVSKEALQEISTAEINRLIFASGVTTSRMITDVSGRGLGMAIVLEKITNMGGTIEVESEPGRGTRFIIRLPQTLATFQGILVESASELFLMPAQAVSRAVRVDASRVKTVESKSVVQTGGHTVALVKLSAVLGLSSRERKPGGPMMTGLLLEREGRRLIFLVDTILGEHEGIVKPLGAMLRRVKHIEGACLMGDGRIVPVLRPSELFVSAAGLGLQVRSGDAATAEKPEQKTRVLVAEDSITIRNTMRNYLELAGCEVTTAFDGQDGFEKLMTGTFDVVVTDVEMPRMNGFELTAQIRKQSALQDLPVIIVTALETPDDRNRGMDAGANAYIVKSNFRESNLIDTIKRLV